MFQKIGHAIEGMLTIALIALGGGASGYFFAQYQMRTFLIDERANHVAELERMQSVYTATIAAMAPKLERIADATEASATASAKAAVNTSEATRVTKQTARAAAPQTPMNEAQRKEVNQKIEDANRKARGKE